MAADLTEAEIRERLSRYVFYHSIPLPHGLTTPGVKDHEWSQQKVLRTLQGLDLSGRRVLDVGCRDGLYSFEAERKGASEVIGIDNDLSPGAVEFLIPFLGSHVRMHALNLLDLKPESFGRFDIVIFAGVLYHLRYPFWGLKALRDVLAPGGRLVVETAVFMDDNRFAMLHCPIALDNVCGPTSPTLFNLKGLADTLLAFGLAVSEIELQRSGQRLTVELKDASCRVPSHPGYRADAAEKEVDRVVLVATHRPEFRDERLHEYFEGMHRLHSSVGRLG